ncbi:hypothetical protein [Carboxylicivirga sp. RSCT41]|uniref:hypothetical protein n=1 Tax=Carboxylicivirga agarovorans TaxID=3417570 RepID=UPI003D327D84
MIQHSKLIVLLLIALISGKVASQEVYAKEVVNAENLSNTDFFSLNYRYIDKDYNVCMDSVTYQEALLKYNLPGLLMKSYTDSVAVAMIMEFDNWDIANKAISKIGYSWTKMSYYLWKTPEETRQLAARSGINHAYLFRQYITRADDNDEQLANIIEDIKTALDDKGLTEYNMASRAEFLSYAYKHNPDKIAFYTNKRAEKKRLMQQYKERHGAVDRMKVGVGCDEENCCQKIQ